MKRLLLLLAFLAGAAQAIAPEKLAIGTDPVIDQAGMLAPADAAALNEKLRGLHQAQVMQGAIVLVDNLNSMSDFDYGMAVFERWQLGDRTRNDGLLILLSEKEHAIRIITGRGIEGDIPDAFAKKIINGMVPSFKQGRFAAGLNTGVDEIAAQLQADPPSTAASRRTSWRSAPTCAPRNTACNKTSATSPSPNATTTPTSASARALAPAPTACCNCCTTPSAHSPPTSPCPS